MGDAAVDGLSDRGSIPLSSTHDGSKEDSRNAGERVPAIFTFLLIKTGCCKFACK